MMIRQIDSTGAIGIDQAGYLSLRNRYYKRWHFPVIAVKPDGTIVFGGDAVRDSSRLCQTRQHAIDSACRWGEATVVESDGGHLIWAVPIMHNSLLLGGLVASALEQSVFSDRGGSTTLDIRAACTDLRLIAEADNLTNAAYLAVRREEYLREQEKAHAIHEFKGSPLDNIRTLYLQLEPELLAAIRRHDRHAARQIVNNMLVAMVYRAGESLSLSKAFFMELVVTMCRTAVEAGGKPEELLGANFACLQQLSRIQSEEQLAPWLHNILDHVMDAIRALSARSSMAMIIDTLEYMKQHLGDNISRKSMARAAHLSPYHFSRLFKQQLGRSSGDMLNQMRVDKAAELLARTDASLAAIAHDCGFCDQSYFSKVFRRYKGATPLKYRTDLQRQSDVPQSKEHRITTYLAAVTIRPCH